MEDINTRYQLRKNLRLQHGIQLTNSQLDTIEQTYNDLRRSNILNIAFYRVISMTIAILGIVFFFLIKGTPSESWFFVGFMALIALYNGVHSLLSYFSYKRYEVKRNRLKELNEY